MMVTNYAMQAIYGLGTGAGLCGWNCYHDYSPFVMGLSERTYTDEWLAEQNKRENTPTEYKGEEYTAYQASQRQRKLETQMRAERQKIKLLKDGGADEADIINARAQYRVTSAEYADFSKAMKLPQQRERVAIDGLGDVGRGRWKVDNNSRNDIIKAGRDKMNNKTQTGAFFGALDPDSVEASLHAKLYYDSVRNMKNDIRAIAKNVGWTEKSIDKLKSHIFLEKHDLGRKKLQYFDSDYNMAVSWQRLIDGRNIKIQDIVLLKHEYLELTLMKYKKINYEQAHNEANKLHNYSKAIKEKR